MHRYRLQIAFAESFIISIVPIASCELTSILFLSNAYACLLLELVPCFIAIAVEAIDVLISIRSASFYVNPYFISLISLRSRSNCSISLKQFETIACVLAIFSAIAFERLSMLVIAV